MEGYPEKGVASTAQLLDREGSSAAACLCLSHSSLESPNAHMSSSPSVLSKAQINVRFLPLTIAVTLKAVPQDAHTILSVFPILKRTLLTYLGSCVSTHSCV